MPTEDEIEQQQKRLKIHRDNLADALDQKAAYGVGYIPSILLNNIRALREDIRRIKATLRGWNVIVVDHPDDDQAALKSDEQREPATNQRSSNDRITPKPASAPTATYVSSGEVLELGKIIPASVSTIQEKLNSFLQLFSAEDVWPDQCDRAVKYLDTIPGDIGKVYHFLGTTSNLPPIGIKLRDERIIRQPKIDDQINELKILIANLAMRLGTPTGAHIRREIAAKIGELQEDLEPFTNLPKTVFPAYGAQDFENADVGIVIALPEEFRIFHQEIKDRYISPRDKETGDYYYLFAHLSLHQPQPYRCVAIITGMGPNAATLSTQRLIQKWKPKTLVMLGIAGSFDGAAMLGDVVVANQIDSYLEHARAESTSDNTSFEFRFGGEVYRSSPDLIRFAEHFEFAHKKLFHQWATLSSTMLPRFVPNDIRTQLIAHGLLRETVHLTSGHLASGSIVGASQQFVAWLKQRDRKYLALDMEAAGLMVAVAQEVDMRRTLILRAISDYADERKAQLDRVGNGGIRQYAMYNAVQILWCVLNDGLLPLAQA